MLLVVLSRALVASFLAFSAELLLHRLAELEDWFPMSVELLAASFLALVLLQLESSVALQVLFQVLSVVSSQESATLLAELSLVSVVSSLACSVASAVLLVLSQLLSAVLSRTLVEVSVELSLELEVLSPALSAVLLVLCQLLSAASFLVLETQLAVLCLVSEQLCQACSVVSVELLVAFWVGLLEAALCHQQSLAHRHQFQVSSSVLPTELSPLAPISSVFKPLYLGFWA